MLVAAASPFAPVGGHDQLVSIISPLPFPGLRRMQLGARGGALLRGKNAANYRQPNSIATLVA